MGRGLRGLVVVLLVAVAGGFAPQARADNNDNIYDESIYTEFYTPPDPLPEGAPGDVIRTEPSRLVLEPSGQLGMIMANCANHVPQQRRRLKSRLCCLVAGTRTAVVA